MVQKRESFHHSDEEPFKPTDPDERLGRVMDELRQLLAGVSSSGVDAPPPTKKAVPPTEGFLDDSPNLSIQQPDQNASMPPPSKGIELPSDQDFWNGNVLGWSDASSAEPDSSLEAASHESLDSSFKSPDILPWPRTDDSDAIKPPLASPSSPPSMLPESHDVETPLSLGEIPPPPSEKRTDITPDAFQHLFETAELKTDEEAAVEPPLENEEIKTPPLQNILSSKAPVLSESDVNADIKIDADAIVPETVGSEEPPAPADDAQPNRLSVKPDNLVHVACLVKAGRETDGQNFFQRLCDLGARLKAPLKIEPVFIHDWAPDRIDMEAWEKSAELSGADIMIILSDRTDAGIFLQKSSQPKEGRLKTVFVYFDTVTHYNLYAGLLNKMRRVV